MRLIVSGVFMILSTGMAFADMSVQLMGGWDGKRVPAGQHCTLQGGNGSTPPMRVSGVPEGAIWIVAYYNDKSYQPLSRKGGHGTIAYPVRGAETDLPAVPGMRSKLPGGARVIKPSRATGQFASPGYLAPCSNGRNNRYTVDLKAVDSQGKVLDQVINVDIGRY